MILNLTNLKYTNELAQKYSHLTRNINEEFINVHPIQRGGILTPEAYKALIAYGDGYSLCDNCLKTWNYKYCSTGYWNETKEGKEDDETEGEEIISECSI